MSMKSDDTVMLIPYLSSDAICVNKMDGADHKYEHHIMTMKSNVASMGIGQP